MLNIKTLAVATIVAVGTAFAMPAASQAMPVAPVKIQTAPEGNVVKADHRRKNWRGDRRKWRGDRRWREARRWRGDRRHYHRSWRHRYYEPYYYDPYYYGYGGGYGYYGPYGGPGIGLQLRID